MVNVDWKKLNKINSQLSDVEDRIRQHEKRLEDLYDRRDILKEEKRLLSTFGKLIPDVLRDWWSS
jgi:uncharacterized protein YeeX (DUF496 family)